MQILGLILAGGKSSRMGSNKALLELKGTTLLQYMQQKLQSATVSNVAVSTGAHNKSLIQALNLKIDMIDDTIANKGPLSGLYSALEQYPSHHLLVVPVDMPFLTTSDLNQLIEHALNACTNTCASKASENTTDQISARNRHFHFPLFIFNSPARRQNLHAQLTQSNRYSVYKFLEQFELEHCVFKNEEALSNINSPEQWQAMKNLLVF